jgi:hypothetical protein
MKTTFKTTTILTSAALAAIFSVAAAFQIPATVPAQAAEIASVTVTAKRMSAEQKLAFDLENQEMQTVVISTKRLTAEQKLAMAQEDQAIQAALVRKAAGIQTNG